MTSITDKTYKKLSIQVSLNGLAFCVFDTLSGKPLILHHIHFEQFRRSAKVEEMLAATFKEHPELGHQYDEICIIHSNNLSTFVPVALFDEEFLGSYLQYSSKVFETDFFAYDLLPNYQMNHVYIPYVHFNNFFIDQYGAFDYKHAGTILVSKLLDLSDHAGEPKLYAHLGEGHFEIVAIKNRKLLLYNSFDYQTPEDFIYYILFTAEQLQLNPETFKLELLGKITDTSPYFERAYQYVREVSLFDVSAWVNPFTDQENREHFILINS